MFESMGVDIGATPWEAACVSFFRRRLGVDDVVGVVVDAPNGHGLASSGVIEIAERIPGPRRPTGRSGYISTISTDPRYQRQGLARAVMDALVSLASARGLDHVELHATEQGRRIYEKLGFFDRPGSPSMSLFL
jgi:ribosomal protein S18 acetylase RimI-like enzyme